MRQRTAQNLHTDNVLHKTYIQTTYCTEPIYRQRTAQNLHTDNLLHRTYIQKTYCTEPTYRHIIQSMTTHTMQPRSSLPFIRFISFHFTSLQFTVLRYTSLSIFHYPAIWNIYYRTFVSANEPRV